MKLSIGNLTRAGAGSGTVNVGDRVLATRSATTSPGTPAIAIPYADADVYDTGAWHDPSGQPSRLTFPGSALIRLGASAYLSGGRQVAMRKNGASFTGRPRALRGNPLITDQVSLKSPPLAVSATDYFESFVEAGASTALETTYNWFAAEVLDPSLQYALVKHSTNQSMSASGTLQLAFDTEVADVGGWHSNVSNNSRLTVPSGVSRVRLLGNIATSRGASSGADIIYLTLRKNGVFTAFGLASQNRDQDANAYLNIASAVLNVTAGDYFELEIFTDSATTVNAGDDTWFAIEEIPASTQCALVNRSTNQSVSAGALTAIQWNAEQYDDNAIHSTSVDTSRLTVPSGASLARLSFNFVGTGIEVRGYVSKNGAYTPGLPMDMRRGSAGAARCNGLGAWMPVTPGDYFEAHVLGIAANTIGNSPLNWFCGEFR